jgi:hypothetical protein
MAVTVQVSKPGNPGVGMNSALNRTGVVCPAAGSNATKARMTMLGRSGMLQQQLSSGNLVG